MNGKLAGTDNGQRWFVSDSTIAPGKLWTDFRKPGLSVGTVENLEVKAGKTRALGDRLILTIDEGSFAFIRGSVFNEDGRSVRGVRVELAKIQDDGSAKKIDGRVSNETRLICFSANTGHREVSDYSEAWHWPVVRMWKLMVLQSTASPFHFLPLKIPLSAGVPT